MRSDINFDALAEQSRQSTTEPKPANPGPANDVIVNAQAGQDPANAETKQLPAVKLPEEIES